MIALAELSIAEPRTFRLTSMTAFQLSWFILSRELSLIIPAELQMMDGAVWKLCRISDIMQCTDLPMDTSTGKAKCSVVPPNSN